MDNAAEILAFWFGDAPGNDAAIAEMQAGLWWRKDPAIDAAMRVRFQDQVEAAGNNLLDHWTQTPHGRLALIILTDQFPRNIHRNTPDAFRFDPKARALCHAGIAAGDDRMLRPIERTFHYLPLEHSESLADQEKSVRVARDLMDEVDAGHRATFEGFWRYAVSHCDIIKRFGRFPHRNRILSRPSTPEEIAFLQTPGSSF